MRGKKGGSLCRIIFQKQAKNEKNFMIIGFILYDYFPFGGLQRDCLGTAEACAARGHEVVIFTSSWRGESPCRSKVKILGRHGFTNEGCNRHFLEQLNSELPSYGLDLLVGFNRMPGLDVYFAGDPCYEEKVARLPSSFWRRYLPRYRHFKRLESAIFAQGQKTQILLLTGHEIPLYEHYYGTEPERFHLLPPGIKRRDSAPEEQRSVSKRVRSAHGWSAHDLLIVMVGSDFKRKGVDRVIKGLASLPQDLRKRCRLVVVGEDHPAPFLRQARRLGVGEAVHFLGGRMDAYDFLLAADLFVHPARSEAAGMVLLEALTAGSPVLTTEVCGYAFHIEKAKAGLALAAPFRQKDFNRSLACMLGNPEAQAARRRNAWAYAACEDLYSCHEKAADFIERMLSVKQPQLLNNNVLS